jgi:hypothetical protein
MKRRTFVNLLLLVCVTCKQPPPQKPAAAAGPQVNATVVTIRTTIQPDKKTYTHAIVIANGLARSTNELDQWRLFDTKAKSVTFVDDIAKTTRTESFESLMKKHRAALAEDLPAHYPRARVTRNATGLVIEVGNYRRELKLTEQRAIPNELFAMMVASDSASSPLAPMMRASDDALLRVLAFPLLDHSELPYGDKKLVVDRAVISVAQRSMPEAMLRAPSGYRDVTPKQAAATPR